MHHQSRLARILSTSGLAVLIAAAAVPAQATTVKFWTHQHPPRLPIDEKIIAAFEAANPDIDIEYEAIPFGDLGTRLVTGFAAGAGPDVFNLLSMSVGEYYKSGFLAPVDLNALGLQDQQALDAAYGVGIRGAVFGGVAYGIPTEVSNWVCVTNNTLWKNAGLNPEADFPKTWEGMVEVAEKLTERDANGVPIRRGFDFGWDPGPPFFLAFNSMVRQLGGTLVNEETYTADAASDASKKVMGYWSDWVHKLKLGGPQYTLSRDAFLAGELATDCSVGIWAANQFREAKIDYTFFPVPRWADATSDNGIDAYYFYLMVNSGAPAEVQQAAWKFAQFYETYGPELFEKAGLFTTAPDVLNSEALKAEPATALFLQELDKAGVSPRVAGFGEIADLFVAARSRIVDGGEAVDPVLTQLQQDVTVVLDRNKAAVE